MKNKLSLKKETIDVLTAMNVYGGVGTLVIKTEKCELTGVCFTDADNNCDGEISIAIPLTSDANGICASTRLCATKLADCPTNGFDFCLYTETPSCLAKD